MSYSLVMYGQVVRGEGLGRDVVEQPARVIHLDPARVPVRAEWRPIPDCPGYEADKNLHFRSWKQQGGGRSRTPRPIQVRNEGPADVPMISLTLNGKTVHRKAEHWHRLAWPELYAEVAT